ncbi:MAG: hypothetical protein A2836_01165 [Candidatus Taylorbacteria bacterium RIFCSPHIGHO2_01_FULL_45_63]|nr:MAG: hypothetical protein A2836_01165 [Candidatus Taylorbacteria bacterium RIFCSPHIGHO2_01_FULL_45_63]
MYGYPPAGGFLVFAPVAHRSFLARKACEPTSRRRAPVLNIHSQVNIQLTSHFKNACSFRG